MINMNKRFIGIIYLLITAIIWGGSFISQLFGGKAIGSYSFIGYRCVFGCLTIAIMIYFDTYKKTGKITFFRKDEDIKVTVINSFWCGFVLFLSMITQQLGVEITDVAKSGLIASLEVIVVPILLLFFYNKHIWLITWIFIITSMVGTMMLSINSVSGINLGDVLVFISTILYSITIIQVPKYIKSVDPLKFAFFRFVAVGILAFIFSLFLEPNSVNVDSFKSGLPAILFSGILASGVAYTFQILGQRYCEPVIATLLMSLEGVFAAIFGWIILGQSLNFLQIIGCIIAIISICIVEITDYYHSLKEAKNIPK